MNKDISLISMHPFVRRFVLSIIKTVKDKGYSENGKLMIDADLVPGVSENVMLASMGINTVSPAIEENGPRPSVEKRDMSELVAPIKKPVAPKVTEMKPSLDVRQPAPQRKVTMPPIQTRQMNPRVRHVPIVVPKNIGGAAQNLVAPVIPGDRNADENEKYGEIAPLLNDGSVSTIECLGDGKELMIIRAGQKQKTRIALNATEIKDILEKIAEEAHIPLIDGVFRVTLKGFSINAVVSEMVGSRFVIKKSTAYGLLE